MAIVTSKPHRVADAAINIRLTSTQKERLERGAAEEGRRMNLGKLGVGPWLLKLGLDRCERLGVPGDGDDPSES